MCVNCFSSLFFIYDISLALLCAIEEKFWLLQTFRTDAVVAFILTSIIVSLSNSFDPQNESRTENILKEQKFDKEKSSLYCEGCCGAVLNHWEFSITINYTFLI